MSWLMATAGVAVLALVLRACLDAGAEPCAQCRCGYDVPHPYPQCPRCGGRQ